MKNNTLRLPKIIFSVSILLLVIVNLLFCILKKPVITEHTFPITITYELDGETVTIQDEYRCTYDYTDEYGECYYDGELVREHTEPVSGDYQIKTYENGELVIYTNLSAGYLMGDSYYDYRADRHAPEIGFYVYEEYVEYTEEEYLAPYNVKITSFEYPEPLENSMEFHKIQRLTRKNVLPMLAVSLLTLLTCIIFVKKDKEVTYGAFDYISIVTNFLVGIIVLPFVTVVGVLVDINGDASDPLSIAMFFVPMLTGLGLAASVCLRRKGYKVASFFAQFAGLALLMLILLVEAVSHIFYF